MSIVDTDFKFLADNSMDLILRIGMDLKYYYVSPASLTLLGWRPEEHGVEQDLLFACILESNQREKPLIHCGGSRSCCETKCRLDLGDLVLARTTIFCETGNPSFPN